MKNKKVVQITESQLCNVVQKTVNKIVKEGLALSDSDVYPMDDSQIVEMSRINKKESGNSQFPCEAWEVKIWSNDHDPAHFHILKDGWDVSFLIQNGDVLGVKSVGKKSGIYKYMVENVKEWLSNPCSAQPKLTNQENAQLQWDQLH